MLPNRVDHPVFRSAPLEDQVMSICLTHADHPERTRAFLLAVRTGEIPLLLDPGSARTRHALTLLGIDLSAAVERPAPAPRAYRALRHRFWAGTLAGQVEAAYRDRERRDKLWEFRRAVRTGLISLHRLADLPRWQQRALARLGAWLPDARGPIAGC